MFPLTLEVARDTTTARVAVIGNAAQALHPVAGQGFNLGLRDAFELATLVREAPRDAQGGAAMQLSFSSPRRGPHTPPSRSRGSAGWAARVSTAALPHPFRSRGLGRFAPCDPKTESPPHKEEGKWAGAAERTTVAALGNCPAAKGG